MLTELYFGVKHNLLSDNFSCIASALQSNETEIPEPLSVILNSYQRLD